MCNLLRKELRLAAHPSLYMFLAMGVVLGGVGFYRHKRLRSITDVTRRFYPGWDQTAYTRYLEEFDVDQLF